MKGLLLYAEPPPHPPFGHLLPAGEKREAHLPLEGRVKNPPGPWPSLTP
ncbi:hypothetical protein J2Z75_001813 [Rhizobium herbae]|uniref:Lytic murein transglycosylase n=1 Tax=Rhizobium herbae TaxID=508661 RepID=A0ABS4EK37_9HYPH|nr:hypothetical protein [Rhizobium herbae]